METMHFKPAIPMMHPEIASSAPPPRQDAIAVMARRVFLATKPADFADMRITDLKLF